jgi:uncharacterized protein
MTIVDANLRCPERSSCSRGPAMPRFQESLAGKHRSIGPLVTDAMLAALAIENGALIASTDRDFRRFPVLRWVDPLGE